MTGSLNVLPDFKPQIFMNASAMARFAFLGLIGSVTLPIVLSLAPDEIYQPFGQKIQLIPIIDALSHQSAHRYAQAVALAGVAIYAVFMAILMLATKLNNSPPFRNYLLGIGRTKRILNSILFMFILMVPWIWEPKNSSRQMSSRIFELASQHLSLFAIFCGGIYIYTSCLLFFVLSSIIFREYEND